MRREDNSLRLLLCSSEFPPGPGGIGTHSYQLAAQLSRLGWEVRVVTPQELATDHEIVAFNSAQPFGVVRQPRWRTVPLLVLRRFLTAWRVAWEWRPDVVVASGQIEVWYCARLAALLGRPWVALAYGSEFLFYRGALRSRAIRRSFEGADAVVAISQYTRDLMRDAGVCPRRVEVVPCGAEAEAFRSGVDVSDFRLRYDLPLGQRYVLTVGSVKERKGQDIVIRALPQLVREFPDLVYLVAGRPFPHEGFQRLAEELGVANHVRFLGRVDSEDLAALYNLSEVFVLVSRRTQQGDVEGYGIVVIEAALCGRPAVVSRDCGAEETVADGETGLIVDPGDPDGTARAIGRLLRDDELRARMGRKAEERARAEATSAQSAGELDRLLRGMVAERGGGTVPQRAHATAGDR